MSEEAKNTNESPRGLLNEGESTQHFSLNFYPPPKDLQTLVNTVWHVSWELPAGQTYLQSNVPHPVQHIVLDPLRGSGLYGCVTKRFDYEIQGCGQVLGFKLFPGFGRAFVDTDLSAITDDFLPLQELIGAETAALFEADLIGAKPIANVLGALGEYLAQCSDTASQAMLDTRSAVEWIETAKEACRVDDVADRFNCSVRQIQRLFSTYLGVSPKWVIERYRILDAVTEMNSGKHVDIVELALRLGYSDQAHFSNKFKEFTGFSPASYWKEQISAT